MGRTFRVFLSSPFDDLSEERRALHEHVFPGLRRLCEEHGARFQPVDLRWGISDEAARHQQTLDICLAEIDRCRRVTRRPNLIVLLGDRYGWRPLPPLLPAALFERLCGRLPRAAQRRLRRWYRLDTNAVPAQVVLRPRGNRVPDDAAWLETEALLRGDIRTGLDRLPLGSGVRRRYNASATELEIMRGVLEPPHAAEGVFCFFRTISGLPIDRSAAPFIDLRTDGSRDDSATLALNDLKRRLRVRLPGRVFDYEAQWIGGTITRDHLTRLCDDARSMLSAAILEELEALKTTSPLDLEIDAHAGFAERARVFVGRRAPLARIASYLKRGGRWPLIVTGASGSGKTALMARAAASARARDPQRQVVARFIGATPDSAHERALIRDLVRDLARRYDAPDPGPLIDSAERAGALRGVLEMAGPERPALVFVDGLDQLVASRADFLDWLPTELPEHTRLVLSALPGAVLERLRDRLPSAPVLQLEPMRADDGERLLNAWLRRAGRTLTEPQRRTVIERFGRHGLPLQLSLAFEEARQWPSHAPARATRLEPTVPGLVRRLLKRLSAEVNHGACLVARSLAYLAASRDGLSDDEMLEVLSRDRDVMAEFRARSPRSPDIGKLADIVWSRLYFDLEPYLVERSSEGIPLLRFFHQQFADVIRQEYQSNDGRDAAHRHLARFFEEQELELSAGTGRANLRKLSELPYQQTLGQLWRKAYETLTDIRFLQWKASNAGVIEGLDPAGRSRATCTGVLLLLDDLELAIARWPDNDGGALIPLRDCLELCTHVLLRDPAELRAQLFGRLIRGRPEIDALLEPASRRIASPWLRPVTATLPGPGGGLLRTVAGWRGHVEVLALAPDGRRAITGGLHGALDVWDLESQVHLYDLKRFANDITALAITPDGRRVIVGAGGGAIAVWDLVSGTQAYPLEPHPDTVGAVAVSRDGRVALSASSGYFDPYSSERARSQVRLWDAATGRHLRTMKGFAPRAATIAVRSDGWRVIASTAQHALEVWDTERRRLLHVLKGHTSYVRSVALTADGRRAISGAGEPWFEVEDDDEESLEDKCAVRVWDPESGICLAVLRGHTDTVRSVAITMDGRVAVSGSDDRTVRVWDLATMTERNVFAEHADHVRAVAVTPDGRRAISASDDKTLKLWDLAVGRSPSRPPAHRAAVSAIAVSPVGNRAVSASADGVVIWDLASGGQSESIASAEHGVGAVAVSGDGRCLVFSDGAGTIHARALETGEELLSADGPYHVKTISVDATARCAAVVGESGRLVVYDLATGAVLDDFGARDPELVMDDLVVLSGDGARLCHLGNHHALVVRRVGGAIVRELDGRRMLDGPSVAAVTSDLRWGIIAAGERTLVWDAERGRLVHQVNNRTSFVTAAAISNDGRHAIIGEDDDTLSVWDLRVGRLRHVLDGHTDHVHSIRTTVDGRFAVSAAESTLGIRPHVTADRSLRIWDLERGGAPLASFSGESSIVAFDIAPDGLTVVAGEESGRVHILSLEGVHPAA